MNKNNDNNDIIIIYKLYNHYNFKHISNLSHLLITNNKNLFFYKYTYIINHIIIYHLLL